MENTFDQNKYKGIINVFHVVLKIFMIFLFIALGVMAVGFVVVLFIPRGLFDVDLAQFSELSTRLTDIMQEIDPNFFTGEVNVKRSILALLVNGLAGVGFLQFVIIQLKQLVGHVKDGQIFEKSNAKILKVLGFGFLAASILLPVFNSISMRTLTNMLDLFQSVSYRFSIQWSHVFMGSLILILAYVFSYGTYLQEEHDLTV